MTSTKGRPSKAVARKRTLRTLELTAAYCRAAEGGYTVEILEAKGVYSQGDTFDEARRNLHEVVALMLEEAPHQFGLPAAQPVPGALLEKLFVLMPQAA
jgi:predicted RNase H-like HicB family nuclease